MIPSTLTNLSVSFTEKQPQNIRLPPLCFTVGIVFLGLKTSPFFSKQKKRSYDQKV